MAGYAKQRALWLDFPTTTTPILAANLNAWETAIYELKHGTWTVQDSTETMTISGAASQSAKIFSIKDNGGNEFLFVDSTGAIRGDKVSTNAPSGTLSLNTASGTLKGTQTVADRYQGYFAQMADAGSVVNKTITNAVNNGSGLIRITCTTHTFATGDKIAVYGVVGATQANGAWTITVIDANTFDLQGSAFSSAYVSGGTATNRPMYYGFFVSVIPTLSRGGLTGTAAHGDDIGGFVAYNAGTVLSGDGFYLAHNSSNAGVEWITGLSIDARATNGVNLGGTFDNAGVRLSGTFSTWGIDFKEGTFTTGLMRLKNNAAVYARNNADGADLPLFRLTTADQMRFESTVELGEGVNVAVGTATGSYIGVAGSKLAFYGNTAVLRPSTTGETVGFTTGAGTAVKDDSTFTGNVGTKAYRLSDIVKHLKNLGLIASS